MKILTEPVFVVVWLIFDTYTVSKKLFILNRVYILFKVYLLLYLFIERRGMKITNLQAS